MKYYQLRASSDPKIIGVTNGVYQAEMIDSKWNKNELDRYVNEYLFGIWDVVRRIKNGEDVKPPRLEYIELLPKAILTDFLTFAESYAGGDYLVSSKLQGILSKYNVTCRVYKDVTLYKSGQPIVGYTNLHLIPLYAKQVVNFEESECFYGSELTGKTFRYPKSYEDYLKIIQEEQLLKFESITLNKSIIGDIDIFLLDIAISNVYISERLKDVFCTENITGINIFEPIEPKITFYN